MHDNIKRSALRGRMAEMGYNITSLALEIDVSRATMSAFLRGAAPSYTMMRKIQRVLGLSAAEACDIFFSQNLRDAKVEPDPPPPNRYDPDGEFMKPPA